MNVLTIENDIVSKLEAVITDAGVKIQSFPNDPIAFYKSMAAVAAILVRYNGSSYDEPVPNRNKVINQIRTVEWIVTILARGLHPQTGHQGVYTYLQDVRQTLTGYTVGTQSGSAINYSTVMYPVTDRYVNAEDGLWEYEIIFRHSLEEVNTT